MKRSGIGGFQESPPNRWILEEPRYAREHLEMNADLPLGGNEEKKQVHRSAVQGIEVQTTPAAAKHQGHLTRLLELAVGDCNTIPDAGTPQPFPFLEDPHEFVTVQTGVVFNYPASKFRQDLVLAG